MEDLKSYSSNFGQIELNSEKFSSGKVYSMDDNDYNNNSIPSRTKASLPENINTYFVNCYGSVFSAQKKP